MIFHTKRVNSDPSGSLFTFFDFRMYLVTKPGEALTYE